MWPLIFNKTKPSKEILILDYLSQCINKHSSDEFTWNLKKSFDKTQQTSLLNKALYMYILYIHILYIYMYICIYIYIYIYIY